MMSIRTIIIDDEQSWIDTISTYVNLHPSLTLVATFCNVIEAFQQLQENPDSYELILLDVNMPQLNGIDFAKLIRTKHYIILCTSSPDYGPQAYDIEAVDYIQKPIDMPKLMKAVERLIARKEADKITAFSAVDTPVKVNQNHCFIRSNNAYTRINFDDLIYIESNENYTKFVTNKEKYMVLVPFQTSLSQLDTNLFQEINRGKAVNLDHITSISDTHVAVSNGDKLAISMTYKIQLKNIISSKLITR